MKVLHNKKPRQPPPILGTMSTQIAQIAELGELPPPVASHCVRISLALIAVHDPETRQYIPRPEVEALLRAHPGVALIKPGDLLEQLYLRLTVLCRGYEGVPGVGPKNAAAYMTGELKTSFNAHVLEEHPNVLHHIAIWLSKQLREAN